MEVIGVQFEKDKESEQTKALARILYDTALLESGFAIEHPKDFNSRVHQLLAMQLGIKGEFKVDVEPDDPEVRPHHHQPLQHILLRLLQGLPDCQCGIDSVSCWQHEPTGSGKRCICGEAQVILH